MSENYDKLLAWALELADIGDQPDTLEADCGIAIRLLESCEITFDENSRFFGRTNCMYLPQQVCEKRMTTFAGESAAEGLDPGKRAHAFSGDRDFGHTTTEWDTVVRLGIFGLRDRLADCLAVCSDRRARFYSNLLRVWDAVLVFMLRAADEAEHAGKTRIADSLRLLTTRAPETLFEAVQTIFVYYSLQMSFDGSILRTLGRLDSTLFPFFEKEEREAALGLIDDMMYEADALRVGSNLPFALGGSDTDGKPLWNELSQIILESYVKVPSSNVKLHLLCTDAMPERILDTAFRAIRDGKNSIVMMSDKTVIKSIEKLGAKHEDAVNYHVVGCYECGAKNELTCSCNALVNIPKAVEYALTGGVDMLTGDQVGLPNCGGLETFDDFFYEFRRQLLWLTKCAMRSTELQDRHYPKLHSAPILSATYDSCVESGRDLYSGFGARYNNSSLNAIGLATAVDSLAAIRKLVYEDNEMPLDELTDILKSDWKDNELLRLRIKNRFPKYGVGDKKTDSLARGILDILGGAVDGTPNVKGGVWRLGTFSIDWRWDYGAHTAASADGRRSGETISQNTSASFGADKEGAAAHLISAASIDMSRTPNGSIVDIDLHSSAVAGDNGINALIASLKTYFELGGFAVHYNVLNTEVLEKAKARPEDYPNLQVRLCGWNVLFSSLSEKEKDEFIARSKKD